MTQVQPDRTPGADALSVPFTPGVPANPPELAGLPRDPRRPPAGAPRRPAHPGLRRAVAQRLVQLLLLGPQVLPRGLPGHPGRAQRVVDPHRLPRQRRRHGARRARHRGRRRRLRQLHPVRGLRAALPEHAVHRRLLPVPHAHGRRRQGGALARRRERRPPAELEESGTSAPTCARTSRCSARRRSARSGCATGPRGWISRSAARRSCSSTARPRSTGRRCRGRWPRCCRWPATSSA